MALRLGLGKIAGAVHEFREQPYTFVAVTICTGVILLVIFAFRAGKDWLESFEIAGTSIVLFGALWTALGVVLNRRHRTEFQRMKELPPGYYGAYPSPNGRLERDVGEIAAAILAASTFAVQGAVLIAIGSLLILIKVAAPVFELARKLLNGLW